MKRAKESIIFIRLNGKMVLNHLQLGFGGGVAATAILSFILLFYVIFDAIVSEEMILLEKLIWIVLAVATGFIGITLYLYIVKYRKEFIADHADLKSVQSGLMGSDTDKLERLSRLKEKGDLTQEEFEKKKADIID